LPKKYFSKIFTTSAKKQHKPTYTWRMEKQKAIKLAGSQVKLAALLGVSQAAISQWGEDVPVMRIYQLKTLKPEWFVNEPTKLPDVEVL
jgi:hypothetical protein